MSLDLQVHFRSKHGLSRSLFSVHPLSVIAYLRILYPPAMMKILSLGSSLCFLRQSSMSVMIGPPVRLGAFANLYIIFSCSALLTTFLTGVASVTVSTFFLDRIGSVVFRMLNTASRAFLSFISSFALYSAYLRSSAALASVILARFSAARFFIAAAASFFLCISSSDDGGGGGGAGALGFGKGISSDGTSVWATFAPLISAILSIPRLLLTILLTVGSYSLDVTVP